jgi:hypothetical protein
MSERAGACVSKPAPDQTWLAVPLWGFASSVRSEIRYVWVRGQPEPLRYSIKQGERGTPVCCT